MKHITEYINESYNKKYAFVRKQNKYGEDTLWWSIVKYLAQNGPSTKKEIYDGLGLPYNESTLRGQHSTEIAAMSTAGIIKFNKSTKKWSTDINPDENVNVKKCDVNELEKKETNVNKNSLEYFKQLEKEGYKFEWSMMRWNKSETGSAEAFWKFKEDAFYAPVKINDETKTVSCMAASFADLGC